MSQNDADQVPAVIPPVDVSLGIDELPDHQQPYGKGCTVSRCIQAVFWHYGLTVAEVKDLETEELTTEYAFRLANPDGSAEERAVYNESVNALFPKVLRRRRMLLCARRILSKHPFIPIDVSPPPPPPPPAKRKTAADDSRASKKSSSSGKPSKPASSVHPASSSVASASPSQLTGGSSASSSTSSSASASAAVVLVDDDDDDDTSPSDSDGGPDQEKDKAVTKTVSSRSHRSDLHSLFEDVNNEVFFGV